MRRSVLLTLWCLGAMLGTSIPDASARGKPPVPDLTKGGKPDNTHDWTLGPTGARGWVEGHRIHVADVAPGSPADGLLEAGDVLLGANGTPFPEGQDPRVALGNAIAESETEARRGRLTLTVQRGRESRTVGLTLRVLGSYSPT